MYSLMTIPVIFKCNGLLIFNFAGLPPLSGFFLKVCVLPSLRVGLGVLLVFYTCIVLFAYLRLFLNRRPKLDTSLVVCFL